MLFELEEISEPALINLKTQQEISATMLMYYLSSQTSTPYTQTPVFYVHPYVSKSSIVYPWLCLKIWH